MEKPNAFFVFNVCIYCAFVNNLFCRFFVSVCFIEQFFLKNLTIFHYPIKILFQENFKKTI